MLCCVYPRRQWLRASSTALQRDGASGQPMAPSAPRIDVGMTAARSGGRLVGCFTAHALACACQLLQLASCGAGFLLRRSRSPTLPSASTRPLHHPRWCSPRGPPAHPWLGPSGYLFWCVVCRGSYTILSPFTVMVARVCILLRMQYDLTRALTVSMRTPSATPASAAPGIRLQGSSRRGCLSLVLALEVCALGAPRLACMRRRDIWSRLVDTVFHFGGRSGFPFCHHFRPLFLDVIISAPAAYLEHGGLALR